MNLTTAASIFELISIGKQGIDALLGSGQPKAAQGTDFAQLLASKSSASKPLPSLDGRNYSLTDPESAYRMMTTINRNDVVFKAQYAELSDPGKRVDQMESLGNTINQIDTNTPNEQILAQMRDFVSTYNQWIDRFAPALQSGGLLDKVQAAEVSLHELEQAVRSPFNGAAQGVRGLEAMGISIDPMTRHASLNETQLNAVLTQNEIGAISAIDDFSANFAKSADLLNASDNFIPKSLDNRSRAIDFIANNLKSLQAEFGRGDPPKPTEVIAKALAAYNSTYAIK